MTPVAEPPPLPAQSPIVSTKSVRRTVFSRRGSDTLAIIWLQSSFHLALFRKQSVAAHWSAPAPVYSVVDFAPALEAGLQALKFTGTEAVLLLDHEVFVHQMESAPPVSQSAALQFLRSKVERSFQKGEAMLWVAQPQLTTRKEMSFLLHLLPSAFYREINVALTARQLDLTRILPVTLPLQNLFFQVNMPCEKACLTVTEIGGSTVLLVFNHEGHLMLSRHMKVDWTNEHERLGIEANRVVLYVKQQFGLVIGQVLLFGNANDAAIAEVTKRCPRDVVVTARPLAPLEIIEATARLPLGHPVNLLSSYLIRKRRIRFTRRALIAATWITASLLGLSLWTLRENAADEIHRFDELRANRPELIAERERLEQRNLRTEKSQGIINAIVDSAGIAVPQRFLAAISSTAPSAFELSECQVRFDTTSQSWTFRLAGQIRASEDIALEQFDAWQRTLASHPLRIRVNENTRTFTPSPYFHASGDAVQKFTAEGALLEK